MTARRTLALVMLAAALLGACGGSDQPDVTGELETPGERAELFAGVQASLVSDRTANEARRVTRAVERSESAGPGRVRGAISMDSGTITYYSVDPAAAVEQYGALDLGDEALEIVDFGPAGVLPVENERPRIYVMFSQPMVPLSQLGDPITESPLLSIDPPAEGVYRWYGTRTLSFEPASSLLDRPRYDVTVTTDASSLGGNALEAAFTFSLFGERLEMVNLYAGTPDEPFPSLSNVPTQTARSLVVEFNVEVDVEQIGEGLSVAWENAPREYSIARPDYPSELESRSRRAVQLTLTDEPPERTRVTVELGEGTMPQEGYPATIADQSLGLRTLEAFEVRRLTAYRGAFPMDNRPYSYPVFLDFSHPLADDAVDEEYVVTLDGEVIEPAGVDLAYSDIRFFVPDARPGQTVGVTVPPTVTDAYDRELGAETTVTYSIPRPDPRIEFPDHYSGLRHLEAEFDPAITFSARNLVDLELGMQGRSFFFGANRSVTREPFDLSAQVPDYVHFYQLDLDDHLNEDGHGTVLFSWLAEKDPALVHERNRTESETVAVQVTDLGVTVRYAYNRVLVWVNRLSDGAPVGDAEVEVFNLQNVRFTGVTDSDGLAVVELPGNAYAQSFDTSYRTTEDDLHVRVRAGSDVAELLVAGTQRAYRFGVRSRQSPENALSVRDRVHLFTDRGMYQPGEELAFRGIHWLQNAEGFRPAVAPYALSITSTTDDTEIWRSEGVPSESGGFSGRIRLPEEVEPGTYALEYRYGSTWRDTATVSFYVGSFRRVTFEVTSLAQQRPVLLGDPVSVSLRATYLAGGAVAGAPYEYFWTQTPIRFVPPGPRWENWTVGTSEWGRETIVDRGEGTLSAAGTASIDTPTGGHELAGKPYRYTVEARVEDLDRQVVAHTASRIVHPADHYVAARFVHGSQSGWWSRFVPTGSEVVARAQLVGIDGEALDAEGTLRYGLIRGEWREAQQQGLYGRLNTRWEYVEDTIVEEEAELGDGSLDYEFSVEDPGRYTVFFVFTDSAGRETRTEIPFYATGSGWVRTASQTPSDIDLVVDKSVYEPGETARILVQSPLPEGRYLLTLEREGILDQRVVELSGSNEIIEVDVDPSYVPVFYVALSSFTERTETEDDYFEPDLGKPRGLFGITTVEVATTPVELDLEIEAESDYYGPGDDATLEVRVLQNGAPVRNAEVTLLAVDRGVLDLDGHRVPNPLTYFYDPGRFPLGVEGDDSRRLLLRPVTYDISTLQGGDSVKLDEREDFNPLALFEPSVRTDDDGYARVTFTFPDSLTTYRVTAVGMDGHRLGIEEEELRVQNPINVRTALPRRFRNRDTAAAGVVLTNTTATDYEVEVTAESDILVVAGDATKRVTVPAGSAYELPFLLEAHEAGEGEIRFTTRSELVNEVLVNTVVVEEPLVREAFTTVGSVAGEEQAATEGLLIPSTISEAYGSLDVALSGSLEPFVEPSVAELSLAAGTPASDVRRLYDLSVRIQGYRDLAGTGDLLRDIAQNQFENGGIGFRPESVRFAEPNPFLSLLVAQVLQQADEAGAGLDHDIDTDALASYLAARLEAGRVEDSIGFQTAWAASILAARGDLGPRQLEFLVEESERTGIAGMALLAEAHLRTGDEATARSVYGEAKNLIVIGTQSIGFRETYEARGYFDSGAGELALLLRAGTLVGESDELLLRLAGALNPEQNARRFRSLHDDFWVVHGFAPILAREAAAGDLGATLRVGELEFVDEPLPDADATIEAEFPLFADPLASLPRDELLPLELARSGEGTLYFTTILRYALPSETAVPRDEGISVSAQVETLDGQIISGEELPLGETLRMRVFLSTTSRRSFLNLRVPLPSGAEILDPNLRTTGSYGDAGGVQSEEWTRETVYGDTQTFIAEGHAGYSREGWWYWFYRPIQRIYDNALLYTWEDFYEGSREVSFLFRTTTPGVYPTPPAEAYLEFEPEVFGRTGGRLFVIPSE